MKLACWFSTRWLRSRRLGEAAVAAEPRYFRRRPALETRKLSDPQLQHYSHQQRYSQDLQMHLPSYKGWTACDTEFRYMMTGCHTEHSGVSHRISLHDDGVSHRTSLHDDGVSHAWFHHGALSHRSSLHHDGFHSETMFGYTIHPALRRWKNRCARCRDAGHAAYPYCTQACWSYTCWLRITTAATASIM